MDRRGQPVWRLNLKALLYHRWLGVTLAGTSLVAVMIAMAAKRRNSPGVMRLYRFAVIFCAVGVGIVGHFGGTLTYGSDYFAAVFKSPTAVPPPPTPQAAPVEASAQEAQVLLYGTAEQVRETRIKLGLAKLPPPPVPPNVNAPVNNDIDRFIIAKWQAAHLDAANHPPELCDDATFASASISI